MYFSKVYQKQKKKLSKKDAVIRKNIEESEQLLRMDPFQGSIRLVGKQLRGLRRIHIGRTGQRVLFSICQECREKNDLKTNNCAECETISSPTTVIVQMIIPRSRNYKKARERY